MISAVDADRELTILLPLKDRSGFTFRWMAYANSIHFPFKVLVADGGADERIPAALSDRTTFPRVDYEYVRYPYDASYAEYHAKIHDALTRVQTPLVAMADNDDFFVVSGVREAVAFLRTHPDYATCGGQCARFWVAPLEGDSGGEALYGRAREWKCSLDTRSVTADTARERLRQQSLRSTYPIYYHVQRTEELRTQRRIVRELNPTDLFLIEYLLSFLSAIAGKTHQLDTLYLARQSNAPGSSGRAHLETFGDWLGRMLVPSWSEDFTKFVDVTSTVLAAHDGMPVDEARRWVVDSYRMYVAPSLLEDVQRAPTVAAPMSRAVAGLHGLWLRGRSAGRVGRGLAPIRDFLTRARIQAG